MFKKLIPITLFILGICFLATLSSAQSTGNHKYLGVKTCMLCHKGEAKGAVYEKWASSGHAKAYQELLSAQSDEIAKKKGLKTAAKDSKECLECHATAADVTPAQISEKGKLDVTDGIVCETCHGPASDYLAIHSKKDIAKAMEAGLVVGANNEKTCTKCHNKKSPTFKSFNYKEQWAKIAHAMPKK